MSNRVAYDYIIAGAGCAGLSMAMQLARSGLPFKKVLIIDQAVKNKNDRTWCFWTRKTDNWFDSIIHKRWNKIAFKYRGSKEVFDMGSYTYCVIRGIDFYTQCLHNLEKDPRFEIMTAQVTGIFSLNGKGIVKTASGTYSGGMVFNSAIRSMKGRKKQINFVQHFRGWLVKTDTDVFDEYPLFMDFDVAQNKECRFVYIIPYSPTLALVEYTGFSEAGLPEEEYDKAIDLYLRNDLNLRSYTVMETEQGCIPMTEYKFVNPFGEQVINIGTAGGSSKPSSGFTFYFIQEHVRKIVSSLENADIMPTAAGRARYRLYDGIFLDVLHRGHIPPAAIFSALFRQKNLSALLPFLNEESTLLEDFRVISALPAGPFARSAARKLIGKVV